MNDYYIRCRAADVPQLYALACALGVLAPIKPSLVAGAPVNGGAELSYAIAPGRVGAWDVIGMVYRPTGNTIASPIGPMAETAPLLDEDGAPYWHANLRINASLMDLARASRDTAVLAGLADIGRWFVVDDGNKVAAPKQPARVWL